MYLPQEIPDARVLITVKTYPNPSAKYDELVCNAGFIDMGGKPSEHKWIRIYPINFRDLPYAQQYTKYSWIRLDLVRNEKDFRPESYRPKRGLEESIKIDGKITTGRNRKWTERKRYVTKNHIFTSMKNLFELSEAPTNKSLATLKPKEIIGFDIEKSEREWDSKTKEALRQMHLFEQGSTPREEKIVKKLPYKYYYRFLTEGDKKPRRLMITDWEVGQLYWNCLGRTGDEDAANELVRKKYEQEFIEKKDLHFFLGSLAENHRRRWSNRFTIVGVFYPPYQPQMSLF